MGSQLWRCKGCPGKTSHPGLLNQRWQHDTQLPRASCSCETCQPNTRRGFSSMAASGLSLERFPRCVRNNPEPGKAISCKCWFSQGWAQQWALACESAASRQAHGKRHQEEVKYPQMNKAALCSSVGSNPARREDSVWKKIILVSNFNSLFHLHG